MINDPTVLDAISKHHLFAPLSDNAIAALMQQVQLCTLDANQVLFHQGDKAESFYFVLQGRIRLYRLAPSGHEKLVELISSGKSFAEALMFAESSVYPVSAVALEPSKILSIPSHYYKKLLTDNPELCFSLMTQMSQRLHSQLNEIENLSLQNALHRLVNYLLQELKGADQLTLDVPKRILASQLAIQPETLSRLLKKLTKAGILEVQQNHLILRDKGALLSLATDNQPLRAQ